MLLFFRDAVGTGFDRLMGDPLDGFIQLAIVQHWENVRLGIESWNAPAYFYPWPGTLGYNDGYLLVGLLYGVARSLSLDPFVAQTAAFMVIRAIGCVFFVLFGVEALGLGFAASVIGGATVTVASNLYTQSAHGQLLTVSLAPLFAWLLWRAGRRIAAGQPLAACAWGAGAAALFGAWLLTAFYTVWFTTFLLLLTGLAALPFAPIRPLLKWPVLVIGACFAVAALPFAWVYLPKAHETGGHSMAETLYYAPSLLDLLDLGRSNLLFGRLDGWIGDHLRPGYPAMSEHSVGFGPIMLALALCGGVIAWRRRRQAPLPLALALATAAALLLCVHIGPHTLWYGVYHLVPGAGAIRVTARFALLLTLPIAAVAMLPLQRLRPALMIPLALLLLAEELSTQSAAGIDRPAELAFLAAIPPTSDGCRVFFTEGRSTHRIGLPIDDIYPHNTDAMLIASLRGLRTINGVSTFNPPDWDLVRPTQPGYLRKISHYLGRHAIADAEVCGLDLTTNTWQEGPPAIPPLAVLPTGTAHPFGDSLFDQILDSGWEGSGPVGRWTTGREASMSFALPPDAIGHALKLRFHGLPIVGTDGEISPLHLLVNGREIATWQPISGRQDLTATIPRDLTAGDIELSIVVDQPRSPSEMGTSPDDRRLGFFVLTFRLDPADA